MEPGKGGGKFFWTAKNSASGLSSEGEGGFLLAGKVFSRIRARGEVID